MPGANDTIHEIAKVLRRHVEKRTLEMFCLASSPLALAYRLVQQFLTLVRKREGHGLDEWLRQVVQSGIPELQSFASGIEKDKEAVPA